MKKIVALVLAMVMVLGLATVASAASYSEKTEMGATTTITGAEKYVVYEAASTNKYDANYAVTAYTALSTKTVVDDGVTTVSYKPAYYTLKTTAGDTVYMFESDAACANYRLFKDGSFVTYLSTMPSVAGKDNGLPNWTSLTATFVAKGEDCGEFGVNVYALSDKTVKAVDGATGFYYAMADGKVAIYNGDASTGYIAHTFTDEVTYKSTTDDTIVSIECDECEKVFTVVKNGLIPATYTGKTQAYGNAYTILLEDVVAATPSTPAGDKVESAETFDAGIAMYVGMSVMAAAGSAVVLKKKD